MDYIHHVRLNAAELSSAAQDGATIFDEDDNEIGTLDHVHGTGTSVVAVVNVGGFLGIGAKRVALPLGDLDFIRDEGGDVHAVTTWTKDQLKALPEHHD